MTLALPGASYWKELARRVDAPSGPFLDGEYIETDSSFEVVDPSTGKAIVAVEAADERIVDRAVRSARAAFEDGRWVRMAPRRRKAVLTRMAEVLAARREEIAALLTLEVGKPIASALSEVDDAAETFAFYGEAADKVYGSIGPTDEQSVALITREPMGVVAAVTPWNYPLQMAAWKVAPALAVGNSVILKPAEQAPLATLLLGSAANAARLPAGALSVLPGIGEVTGAALGRHIDVDAVSFTGSTTVGKLFLGYAGASNMKSVTLECGGKSPNIILADVEDPEIAARVAAEAIYSNAGENCNAGSRLLVDRRIHDDFMADVIRAAREWVPGDPFDPSTRLGALVDDAQLRRVTGYIRDGVQAGACLAHGGRAVLEETGGFFVEPTVFTDVGSDMAIAREEIFGPVLAVIPFDEVDEAVAIANATTYGLAAGVWTRDVRTAHRLARDIRAGVIYVNCYNRGELSVPFGGYKQSGIGVDKSLMAMEKYCHVKSTWFAIA